MANKIVLKKSAVSGKIPNITDLELGEVALNYADGLLYFKNSSNVIKSFQSDLSSYVTLTGTQSLTNKTLVDPIITASGSNGTAGQFLQSNGNDTISWETVPYTANDATLLVFTRTGSVLTILTSLMSNCLRFDNVTTRTHHATVFTRSGYAASVYTS